MTIVRSLLNDDNVHTIIANHVEMKQCGVQSMGVPTMR